MTEAAAKQQFEKAANLRDVADNLDCLYAGRRRNLANVKIPSLDTGEGRLS